MKICLSAYGYAIEGQICRCTLFFRGTSGPQFHPGGPLAARRLFLQQWNRPPVQRQTSRRTERRCDRAVLQLTWPPCEKRSAEEDDLREETGDKEGCGNDRTLALPRTTSKRLKKISLKICSNDPSRTEKSAGSLFPELPYVPKASRREACEL